MHKTKYLKNLFWISYLILLIIAGLGFQRIWTVWVGMAYSLICLLFLNSKNVKLAFPKNFKLYALFLALFLVSMSWSNNFFVSFPHFLTYVAAGILWLFFYNLKLRYSDTRDKMLLVIILVGVYFGSLFLLQWYQGTRFISSFGLNGFTSINFNHHHVGDLFAVVILVAIYQILKDKKYKLLWLILLVPGSLILFVSGSRSAYVSLAGGLLYLLNFKINLKAIGRWFIFVSIFLLLVGFLYISSQKDLMMSREYYIQAVAGLFKHPFGVGFGNFALVSSDPATHLFGLKEYSIAAHNIILEIMSGMGVFGLIFLYWFFLLIYGLFRDFKKRELLINSLIIVFAVNFFFDITYFIPTMLWLWFSLLGIKTE